MARQRLLSHALAVARPGLHLATADSNRLRKPLLLRMHNVEMLSSMPDLRLFLTPSPTPSNMVYLPPSTRTLRQKTSQMTLGPTAAAQQLTILFHQHKIEKYSNAFFSHAFPKNESCCDSSVLIVLWSCRTSYVVRIADCCQASLRCILQRNAAVPKKKIYCYCRHKGKALLRLQTYSTYSPERNPPIRKT